MAEWLSQNWFTGLSAIGIIGGLLFTADSLRSETKTRRVANLLATTQSHREIWKLFFEHPELSRVLNPSADLAKHPVTRHEEIFVNLVLLQLSTVYHAMKDELLTKLEGLRRDVGAFISLPVPKKVWENTKILQNNDFVEFVESCRGGKSQ